MSADRVRTVVLTERVTRQVRLAPVDVEFLLARHRGHLDLRPAGHRHRYLVTPLGHVGVLVAPSCRLVIRPKVPLQNLLILLEPTVSLPASDDSSSPEPAGELLDFLGVHLASLLTERAATGLHRDYRERDDEGPVLHGRLDLPAQLRETPGRKDRLHGRVEDLSVDVPCNQAAKATAERLLSSGLLSDGAGQALARALRGYEGVSAAPLGPELFARAQPDRRTEAYRPLLDLCRLLADALAPGERCGDVAGPAFLLDLERVFERYLTRGVCAAFADTPGVVAVQPSHRFPGDEPAPEIVLRPDVTLNRDGRPVLIVDAKWKRLPREALVTSDVHQALAYGAALGARRALLVYPGRRDRRWTFTLTTTLQLEVRTLAVTGSRERCRRSLRRLGRTLRRSWDALVL
jgi:5-methylcytosine-specific restriction enzyme subunit McrC